MAAISTIVATTAAVASAGYAANEQIQSTKAAETQQRREQELIKEQEAQALDTRKTQIDQQREQLGVGAYSTKTTKTASSTSGVKGTLGNTLG